MLDAMVNTRDIAIRHLINKKRVSNDKQGITDPVPLLGPIIVIVFGLIFAGVVGLIFFAF